MTLTNSGSESEKPENMTVSLLQHCKDAGQADTYIVEHPEEEEGEETKTKRARETDTKS